MRVEGDSRRFGISTSTGIVDWSRPSSCSGSSSPTVAGKRSWAVAYPARALALVAEPQRPGIVGKYTQ